MWFLVYFNYYKSNQWYPQKQIKPCNFSTVSLLLESYWGQNWDYQTFRIQHLVKGSIKQWKKCVNNQLSKNAYICTGSLWVNVDSSSESSLFSKMMGICYLCSYISLSLSQYSSPSLLSIPRTIGSESYEKPFAAVQQSHFPHGTICLHKLLMLQVSATYRDQCLSRRHLDGYSSRFSLQIFTIEVATKILYLWPIFLLCFQTYVSFLVFNFQYGISVTCRYITFI